MGPGYPKKSSFLGDYNPLLFFYGIQDDHFSQWANYLYTDSIHQLIMETDLSSGKVLEIARNLLKYMLCDSCLGRQFGKIGHGMTNMERGRHIRRNLDIVNVEGKRCWLCSNIITEIRKFSHLVMQSLKDYEYETFLVGSNVSDDIHEREQKLQEITPFSEPIKHDLNREIGKIIEKKTGKTVDFKSPDITALVDTSFDHVTLDIRSLFIYGRYWKLIRGIPQTKWYCKKCRGFGCQHCGYKGKKYDESIEELVAKIFLEKSMATTMSFHGAGREDIDAKMLGNGRPFVLELKNPKKRFFPLEDAEKESNEFTNGKIKISNLGYVSRHDIEKLKSAKWEKSYQVQIRGEIDKRKLKEAVMTLRGKIISQRTPCRVLHRRPDILRKRKIIDIGVDKIMAKSAILTIRADAGTYIKEFINGDGGRTTPSVAETLGKEMETVKLDVIQIHDQG